MQAYQIKQQELLALLSNTETMKEIGRIINARSNLIRKILSHNQKDYEFSREEQDISMKTAVTVAYYNHVMWDFLASKGLGEEWMTERRVEAGLTPTDRKRDYEIVHMLYPELDDYVPSSPVKGEDILGTVQHIFCDLETVPGTDYGEVARENYSARRGKKIIHNDSEADGLEYCVSEPVMRVVRWLILHFGVRPTLYWVVKKGILCDEPKSTNELIRLIAGELPDDYASLSKDIRRKIPFIDNEVRQLMDSAYLQDYKGEVELQKEPGCL